MKLRRCSECRGKPPTGCELFRPEEDFEIHLLHIMGMIESGQVQIASLPICIQSIFSVAEHDKELDKRMASMKDHLGQMGILQYFEK